MTSVKYIPFLWPQRVYWLRNQTFPVRRRHLPMPSLVALYRFPWIRFDSSHSETSQTAILLFKDQIETVQTIQEAMSPKHGQGYWELCELYLFICQSKWSIAYTAWVPLYNGSL